MSFESYKQRQLEDDEFADESLVLAMSRERLYQGAVVGVFKHGIVRGIITHIDVSSMYPMIMAVCNLSPESVRLAGTTQHTGRYFLSPELIEVPDEMLHRQVRIEIDQQDSISRKKLLDFYQRRQEYKKAKNDAAQLTMKIFMNAMYGYNGMRYSRYGSFLVSIVTTALGRLIITTLLNWLKENGFEPLELDTDGIYAEGEVRVSDAVGVIRELFSDFALSHLLGLGAETYEGMIIAKMKNYVLRSGGKNVFKGSSFHGRSMPRVCESGLEQFASALFEGRDLFETWDQCKHRLTTAVLPDFEMVIELGKAPEEYEDTSLYSKLFGQLNTVDWGDEIRYVKVQDGYEPLGVKPEQDVIPRLDLTYYEKRLKATVGRLVTPLLGTDPAVDAFHAAVLEKKKRKRGEKKSG